MTKFFPNMVLLLALTPGLLLLGMVVQRDQVSQTIQVQSLGAGTAIAQNLSLSGELYRLNTSAPTARPLANPGYRVYLYSKSQTRWIGPSITDSYGKFAFYDMPPGLYFLRIYPPQQTNQTPPPALKRFVWQQEVKIPGKVPPIVLK
jgi:hypothetical protein